jgi:hypothetical protein
MVKVKDNLIGKAFGRLIVLEQSEDYVAPNGKRYPQWLCECSCSEHNKIVVKASSLKSGRTKSCGCLHREVASKLGSSKGKVNKYDLSGEHGIGYCSNTGSQFYFDLEDYDKIKDYCWIEDARKDKYHALRAEVKGCSAKMYMHQIIVGPNYDHINRNPLDNRKCNLRPCTHQENTMNRSMQSNNTSGIIGVSWDKRTQQWRAQININKKAVNLGRFNNKEDAIKTRLLAEMKYYGEFAPQKHLYEQYGLLSATQNE